MTKAEKITHYSRVIRKSLNLK